MIVVSVFMHVVALTDSFILLGVIRFFQALQMLIGSARVLSLGFWDRL